jgi:hypothetical protein
MVEWAKYHLHASFRTEEYHLCGSFRIMESPLPGVGQSNSSDLSRQSAVPSHFLVRGMQVWSLHSNSLLEHLGAETKVSNHVNCKKTNKIKYKRIRQTHLVYLLFIVELATCFDPAGSLSGLYVNQVMLKNCILLRDPIDVYERYILVHVYNLYLNFIQLRTHIIDVLKMRIKTMHFLGFL